MLFIALMFFAVVDARARERVLWDFDWHFCRGAEPSAWRAVELPHDWSIERVAGTNSLFDKKYPQSSGCLPGGIGWYRKTFTLPATATGQRLFVEFEGVYMNSDVWINGRHLGNRPYGYIGFEYELTPHLKWDAPNDLVVRAKVEQPCSRWFSGAGIYRHVWLTTTAPVRVAHWGVSVATQNNTVRLRTQLTGRSGAPREVTLRSSIVDAAGRKVAFAEARVNVERVFEQTLTVEGARRWSLKEPYLYTLVSEVMAGGKVIDRVDTPFGFRAIEFTKDRGFLLNREQVAIKGVCNHHDQGYLGAAAYDRAIERQLEILKTMGCNAIRTSHNPPAPKLLELCDRMGFLVMDEAFDEWKQNKTKLGYGRFFDEWSERDLRDLIRRDRNHPSVVLWSIGNEVSEQGASNGGTMAKRLADIARDQDPTRPITAACQSPGNAIKTGFADALDVFGINYNTSSYPRLRDKYNLIASETSSAVSTRGEYNLVLKGGQVVTQPRLTTHGTAYDLYQPFFIMWTAPKAGQPGDDTAYDLYNPFLGINVELQHKRLADNPWIAGEFVWTGFDYIGEPAPFPWPAVSSSFGIIDLCGFPKDRFYLYQSRWTDKPVVHLLPHWNWPQFESKEIPVWCYSNAETVELVLNGKSLGEKKMSDTQLKKYRIDKREDKKTKKVFDVVIETGWYHQEWLVPFSPGTLKAVAKTGAKVVAIDEVTTAAAPAQLEVRVDRNDLAADGQDLAYVTVRVLDAEGRICPDAANVIHFDVKGAGTLAAVGNGNPVDHDDSQATTRKAFHGLCLGIVKAGRTPGMIRVAIGSDGLRGAEVKINTR